MRRSVERLLAQKVQLSNLKIVLSPERIGVESHAACEIIFVLKEGEPEASETLSCCCVSYERRHFCIL